MLTALDICIVRLCNTLNFQKQISEGSNNPEPKTPQLHGDAIDLARPQRKRVTIILILVTIVMTISLFVAAISYFQNEETTEAQNRLSLYTRSLNDTLERFQYLPFVLARDTLVMANIDAPTATKLNARLAKFAEVSKLEAIYLMNLNGVVIASSNHDTIQSFMDQNYGFRPYFQKAREGRRGEFFGVGATTGRPGYFISEPVYQGRELIGVIAIKIDMSELQALWERGDENVFVSNSNGVIVLSSNPDWLYQTLQPLSDSDIKEIQANKQFIGKDLTPLAWTTKSENSATLGQKNFIYANESVTRLKWTVHFLLSEARMFERAIMTTIIFGAALAFFLVFATFMRSARIRTALLVSQSDRAQLLTANHELKTAQEQLSRTSKLAALGQLSASVTHELGQPISALRNHLTAAEISGELKQGKTLKKLNLVVDRMENITKQLRFFTRPIHAQNDTNVLSVLSLDEVIKGGMELMVHDLLSAKIDVLLQNENKHLMILGNRLRLEQVLVNLITNSAKAMDEIGRKKLEITLEKSDGNARIIVRDNGSGFGERNITKLQEPFHTTRASGDGMGLGLSIATEIIQEHNGSIQAQNLSGGGAEFIVSIPLANNENIQGSFYE